MFDIVDFIYVVSWLVITLVLIISTLWILDALYEGVKPFGMPLSDKIAKGLLDELNRLDYDCCSISKNGDLVIAAKNKKEYTVTKRYIYVDFQTYKFQSALLRVYATRFIRKRKTHISKIENLTKVLEIVPSDIDGWLDIGQKK